MKRKQALLFVISFVFLVLMLWLWPFLFPPEKTGAYPIRFVTDGDTLHVEIKGEDVTIRLIGLDAPEIDYYEPEKSSEEGNLAKEYLKELCRNKKAYVEYDAEKTDKYGRTLAYLWLEDGTFLNEKILEDGYADVLTISPNTRHSLRLTKAFFKARLTKAGLWAK